MPPHAKRREKGAVVLERLSDTRSIGLNWARKEIADAAARKFRFDPMRFPSRKQVFLPIKIVKIKTTQKLI